MCSGFISDLNGLKCRVDVNFARVDVNLTLT